MYTGVLTNIRVHSEALLPLFSLGFSLTFVYAGEHTYLLIVNTEFRMYLHLAKIIHSLSYLLILVHTELLTLVYYGLLTYLHRHINLHADH